MLSEWVQYQGKAGCFKFNFQISISWNTGKCKVYEFFTHIVT